MTNDEAIRILENAPWFKWAGQATVISKEVERVREAEQMAIDALKAQLPKEDATSDCISRQEAIRIASGYCHFTNIPKELAKLPPVQPTYTDEIIQRIQGLEQAQLEKAFDLGREDAMNDIIHCKDCKHWREGTAFSFCDKLHRMGVLDALDYMTAEDDYCSMAEREDDGFR